MSLVFLDTETTGLELHHDIWEMAWAVDDGPIQSCQVSHSIANADPEALAMNGYWDRFDAWQVRPRPEFRLRKALEGATIVAANPTFDATRLERRWGCAPWHYRMIDVSSMSVPLLGLREDGKVKGLFDIAQELREDYGVVISEPDHSAARDVEVLRDVYRGLLHICAGTMGRRM